MLKAMPIDQVFREKMIFLLLATGDKQKVFFSPYLLPLGAPRGGPFLPPPPLKMLPQHGVQRVQTSCQRGRM